MAYIMIATISGIVVHGDHYGRRLGYPTANLDEGAFTRSGGAIQPGVYAGFTTLSDGRRFLSGILIGPKSTQGPSKIEAHLLDFDEDLYDQEIMLEILQKTREYEHFEDEELLKETIKKDLSIIQDLLSK